MNLIVKVFIDEKLLLQMEHEDYTSVDVQKEVFELGNLVNVRREKVSCRKTNSTTLSFFYETKKPDTVGDQLAQVIENAKAAQKVVDEGKHVPNTRPALTDKLTFD